MTNTPDSDMPTNSRKSALLIILGGIFTIFLAGIVTGIAMRFAETGEFRLATVVGGVLAVVTVALGYWIIRRALLNARLTLPRSPRMRRSRIALYLSLAASVGFGIVVGVMGGLSDEIEPTEILFSSQPLAPTLAIWGIVGLLAAIGFSAYWHSTIDEMERRDYDFGTACGLYTYVSVAPAWWLAWRGGLTGEPDDVAIFWIVCVTWSIGWLWRRYS